MPTHAGTRITTALESTWAAFQRHHPDLPDVVMITGTGTQGRNRKRPKLGHHCSDRWLDAAAGGRRAELFISGEAIAAGGQVVVETALHEAAHTLAAARDIRDTSCAGRWHNRRFAELAREVGLEPPKRAEPVIGFSGALITAATVSRYASVIRKLDTAALARIETPDEGGDQEKDEDGKKEGPRGGKGRAGKRLAVACACEKPRRMQVTPKLLEGGAILCGECQQPFQPDEPELEDDEAAA
ncbi:hypothetical protein [Streptomyces sp. enrichment culture]|uniref:hypothetical protein n=1 Tax=Streptomyces sp. enrichment culture TaxID=1795815 RepID=UPI003F54DAA8